MRLTDTRHHRFGREAQHRIHVERAAASRHDLSPDRRGFTDVVEDRRVGPARAHRATASAKTWES